MLESDPFTAEDSSDGVIFRESDRNSAHRDVAEDDRQQERRQHEYHIQLPVLPNIDQCVVRFGISAASGRSGFRCFFH